MLALQVDKFALDALNENAEGYMHNLEQWILVCPYVPSISINLSSGRKGKVPFFLKRIRLHSKT